METLERMLLDEDIPVHAILMPNSEFSQGGYIRCHDSERIHHEIMDDLDTI